MLPLHHESLLCLVEDSNPCIPGLEGPVSVRRTKHGGRSADESTRTHGGDEGLRSLTSILTGLYANHYNTPPLVPTAGIEPAAFIVS